MHAFLYCTSGLLVLVVSYLSSYLLLRLALLWLGLSLLAVGLAYLFNKPGIFRKRSDGSIPSWVRWLFIPFLVLVTIYNKVRRQRASVPAMQKMSDKLYVGSRITGSEIELLQENNITAILDVTAEFDALNYDANNRQVAYLNIPILDHAVPSKAQLNKALHWIEHQRRLGRTVLVHCALGRGRSVLMVLAYLLAKNPKGKIAEVVSEVQAIRRKARLNRRQMRFLKRCQNNDQLIVRSNVYVIANAKSGGGKWLYQGRQVMDRLGEYFTVRECLLSECATAADWIRQAKQDEVEVDAN